MVQCSAAFPGKSIADFFRPGEIDHTPVTDIASFKDLDATFGELQNKKATTSYMRSIVDDFVRMYSEVLDRQTQHEYVSVSWANALQWVVSDVSEFELQNEDEKRSWLTLWTNASVLQKQAQKFKHQYKFLAIAKCFYPLT